MKNKLREEWIKSVIEINAITKQEDIDKITMLYDTTVKNGVLRIHNSVYGEYYNIRPEELYYTAKDKYIMNETGLLTFQHKLKLSVNSSNLFAGINKRQIFKKIANTAEEAGDYLKAKINRLIEGSKKVCINGFYGLAIYPCSPFTNADTAASCTAAGRMGISITNLVMESLNYGYRYYNPIAYQRLINKSKELALVLDDELYIKLLKPKSDLEIYEHMLGKYADTHENRENILYNISQLNTKEKTILYYKNNFALFVRTPFIAELIYDLFNTSINLIKAGDDKPYLLNIKDTKKFKSLQQLKDLAEQLLMGFYYFNDDYVDGVHYDNLVDIMTSMKRTTTVGMDTDSGIHTLVDFISEIENYMLEDNRELFDDILKYMDEEKFKIMLSYVVVSITNSVIQRCLWDYHHEIGCEPKYAKYIELECEYIFYKEVLTVAKKSYIALPLTKDGYFVPAKTKKTGVQYIKSNHNQQISSIVSKVIDKYIMIKQGAIDYKELILEIKFHVQSVINNMKTDNFIINDRTISKVNDEIENVSFTDSRIKSISLWNRLFPNDKIDPPCSYGYINLCITDDYLDMLRVEHNDIYEHFVTHTYNIIVYSKFNTIINKSIKCLEKEEEFLKASDKIVQKEAFNKLLIRLSKIQVNDRFNMENLIKIHNYIEATFIPNDIKIIYEQFKVLKVVEDFEISYKDIISHIDRIGLPLDLVEVPHFIKLNNYQIINIEESQLLEHLVSQVLESISLATPKNSLNNCVVTNILQTY